MEPKMTPPPPLTKENAAEMTLFEVLGFTHGDVATVQADISEVQRRFRRRSLLFHPDKDDSPGAREIFEKLKLATETLCDPQRLSDYVAEWNRTSTEIAAQRKANATVDLATELLRQRQAAAASAAAIAKQRKEAAKGQARNVYSELASSYDDVENRIISERDVDAALLLQKENEVMQLIRELAARSAAAHSQLRFSAPTVDGMTGPNTANTGGQKRPRSPQST